MIHSLENKTRPFLSFLSSSQILESRALCGIQPSDRMTPGPGLSLSWPSQSQPSPAWVSVRAEDLGLLRPPSCRATPFSQCPPPACPWHHVSRTFPEECLRQQPLTVEQKFALMYHFRMELQSLHKFLCY